MSESPKRAEAASMRPESGRMQEKAEYNALTAENLKQLEPSLLKLARSYTHDETKAKDLLQITFEKALRHKNRFAEGTNLRAWLMVILKNAYRDSLRRNKFWDQGDPEIHLAAARDVPSQDAEIDVKEIEELLQKISPRHRLALELIREGSTYEEIAGHLSVQPNSVKSLMNRARKSFAKVLFEAGYIETGDAIVGRFLDSEPGER